MAVREIVVSLTDACNARCRMCSIWKGEKESDLDLSLLDRLPKSLVNVNLTGGEPFMRRDISEATRRIRAASPRARIVVTTNGMLFESIAAQVRQILRVDPDFAFRVSLDAIGEKHDRIRGVPGAFNAVHQTLILLKKSGVRDIGVNLTAQYENQNEILSVYQFARAHRFHFNLQLVESSQCFFGKEGQRLPDPARLRSHLAEIIGRELLSFDPYRLLKAYYLKTTIDDFSPSGNDRSCGAADLFTYVSSDGKVHPCILSEDVLGSLSEMPLIEILASRGAKEASFKSRRCIKRCRLICTVAPGLKARPWRPLAWVLRQKMLAHVGKARPFLP